MGGGVRMQSIVSKGKDMNEAIQLGLKLLGTTIKEVDIEIIQQESKGFLKLGSKEAVVKLTIQKDPVTLIEKNKVTEDPLNIGKQLISDLKAEEIDQDEEKLLAEYLKFSNSTTMDKKLNSFPGKAWVTNGRLFCESSPNQYPMVTIPNNIILYKNNEVIKEKTIIMSEKDLYELEVKSEEVETKWNVTMDELKLKVFLYVEPGYKLNRIIHDIEPNHHIELYVEEEKEIINTLTYDEVLQRLGELRVKHGFNQNEITKALEAIEPETFEVVTGISPKQGKDGWVEIMMDLITREGPKEKADGRVDFRETKHFPTIDRGKVIGIVHPPLPGQLGYTVTNDPLPAKQTFPIVVKAGKGAVIIEEEKIVATESGRPKMEQRGQLVKVSIMPKLVHSGDVDLISGNLRFVGDIEIHGAVEENMIVEAEGDITVQKTVSMATITTSGAIVAFGNIIGSEISAGKNNMLVGELGHLLGILHQHTENIISVIKQLTISPAFKSTDFSKGGLQPLIRILLEKKFKNFPPLVKNYVEIVKRGETYLEDEAWKEIATSLTQLFLTLTKDVVTLERIKEISANMKEVHDMSQTPVEPDSYVTVLNVHNSRVYCSGNIIVMGQGCVNSKIHAGGTLKISGVLRGGEVYGRQGVQINEVGAESGTITMISVPNDQKISIKKAMEGTSIKIGNVKHTFRETRLHVEARLDQNNQIKFE